MLCLPSSFQTSGKRFDVRVSFSVVSPFYGAIARFDLLFRCRMRRSVGAEGIATCALNLRLHCFCRALVFGYKLSKL